MDIKDTNIQLIGGSGRSGTTILAKIFKNHSKVIVAPEWRFLIDPDGILDFIYNCNRWSPYHVDMRLKRLKILLSSVADVSILQKILNKKQFRYFVKIVNRKILPKYNAISARSFSPNYTEIVERLFKGLSENHFSGYWVGMPFLAKTELYYTGMPIKEDIVDIFRRFVYSIIEDVKQAHSATYYVEKNTWNILWYDEILQLLPHSKLVHIYRDPRDVVASYCKQTWMPSSAKDSAQVLKNIMDRWEIVKIRVPRESYLEISLEQLVLEPEMVLKEVCSFWKIPFESTLLKTDLSRSNMGRWKKQFNSKEQAEVEFILKDNLEKFGYE
jgi:hypothetical protein